MTRDRMAWIAFSLALVSLAGGCATRGQADVPLVREVAERTVWRTAASSGVLPSTTHDQKLRVRDPYLWVYNASFAQDFGMPERWIDNSLNGADALAFRTTESLPMCGWGGRRDACRVSSICILEMFFHHGRNPLPWNEALRWTDLWFRNTSVDTLRTLRSLNRAESEASTKSPIVDPGTKNDLQWWYAHTSPRQSGGGASIVSYDQSIFGSYSLVVLDFGCMHPELSGLDLASKPLSPTFSKPYRSIVFPIRWRLQLKEAIQEIKEESSQFFRDQFRQIRLSRQK